MKGLMLSGSALLLLAQAVAPRPPAGEALAHLRFERKLRVPAQAAGEVCAALDADVLAHMASRSGNDLRVVREGDTVPVETPYFLTESGVELGDAAPAAAQAVEVHGEVLSFNLAMPARPYTAVELQLAATDFVAEAIVTGLDPADAKPVPLGSFTLFDLSREHLARSAELALPESRFPRLHVVLRLHGVRAESGLIRGATVPASREAQTLHSVVASARVGQGQTFATFTAPAHVPVEAVRLVLDPAWKGEFLRTVQVQGEAEDGSRDVVRGVAWRVARPSRSDGAPAIDAEKLSMDAVLGMNLRSPATITVSWKDGSPTPVPVRAVQLEMRQRMVCFNAAKGARYSLRYGDAALQAPVYMLDGMYAGLGVPAGTAQAAGAVASPPQTALLGVERWNALYVARPAEGTPDKAHSHLAGAALLAVATLAGWLALRSVWQRKRK